jgi:hypothetical protein
MTRMTVGSQTGWKGPQLPAISQHAFRSNKEGEGRGRSKHHHWTPTIIFSSNVSHYHRVFFYEGLHLVLLLSKTTQTDHLQVSDSCILHSYPSMWNSQSLFSIYYFPRSRMTLKGPSCFTLDKSQTSQIHTILNCMCKRGLSFHPICLIWVHCPAHT